MKRRQSRAGGSTSRIRSRGQLGNVSATRSFDDSERHGSLKPETNGRWRVQVVMYFDDISITNIERGAFCCVQERGQPTESTGDDSKERLRVMTPVI